MFRSLLPLTLVFLTAGCSIYKSAVRKEFESNSHGRVAVAATEKASGTEHCRLLGPVQTWIESEFPGEEEELLHADDHSESWLARKADGRLRLKSFETSKDGTVACERVFASEADWLIYSTGLTEK